MGTVIFFILLAIALAALCVNEVRANRAQREFERPYNEAWDRRKQSYPGESPEDAATAVFHELHPKDTP